MLKRKISTEKTIIHKTQHRKTKTEQHKSHEKLVSSVPEWQSISCSQCANVVLLIVVKIQ